MLLLKILIVELLAVDALATSTITSCEVTTLDHELLDDSVEHAALVVEGLASLSQTLLAGAEGAKVLGRLGHNVIVQLKGDATGGLAADLDVKEDLASLGLVGHGEGLCCRLRTVDYGGERSAAFPDETKKTTTTTMARRRRDLEAAEVVMFLSLAAGERGKARYRLVGGVKTVRESSTLLGRW